MVRDYEDVDEEFGASRVSEETSNDLPDTADMEAESETGINSDRDPDYDCMWDAIMARWTYHPSRASSCSSSHDLDPRRWDNDPEINPFRGTTNIPEPGPDDTIETGQCEHEHKYAYVCCINAPRQGDGDTVLPRISRYCAEPLEPPQYPPNELLSLDLFSDGGSDTSYHAPDQLSDADLSAVVYWHNGSLITRSDVPHHKRSNNNWICSGIYGDTRDPHDVSQIR